MEKGEIIPVYKPVGFSTYDLVRIFKRKFDSKEKIGHSGTLDPFACGLVLILKGQATKKFEEIKNWEKVYLAGLRFGLKSLSGDIEGPIEEVSCQKIKKEEIEEKFKFFLGRIKQKVPPFSAAKIKGKPLYLLAREGKMIKKEKEVEIKSIEILTYKWPFLLFRVKTLGGVYIRQLALDLSEKLNYPGTLFFLEREKIGPFTKEESLKIV